MTKLAELHCSSRHRARMGSIPNVVPAVAGASRGVHVKTQLRQRLQIRFQQGVNPSGLKAHQYHTVAVTPGCSSMPCMRGERDSRPRNTKHRSRARHRVKCMSTVLLQGTIKLGKPGSLLLSWCMCTKALCWWRWRWRWLAAGGWPLAAGDGDGDGNDDGGDDADYHD